MTCGTCLPPEKMSSCGHEFSANHQLPEPPRQKNSRLAWRHQPGVAGGRVDRLAASFSWLYAVGCAHRSADRCTGEAFTAYGPQTESANREKAFIDLFNAGHIEGLYLTVGNRTDPRTRQLIGDVAQIIAGYRQRMTPAEKASLGNYFFSPAGRAQIHDATGSYQSKSPQFRAVAAPVIQEILTTLTTLPATTKP